MHFYSHVMLPVPCRQPHIRAKQAKRPWKHSVLKSSLYSVLCNLWIFSTPTLPWRQDGLSSQ